jgi:hypothetical protein
VGGHTQTPSSRNELSWQRLGKRRECTQTPSSRMNLSWQRLGTMFHVEHSFMVGRCQLKLDFREKEFKKSIK